MLITTSFSQAPQFQGRKYSIANSQPQPYQYAERRFLAPAWIKVCGLKNRMLSEDDFVASYKFKLDNLSISELADLTYDMAEASIQDIIYLCWEPAGKFCHRNILADWLEEKYPDLKVLRR